MLNLEENLNWQAYQQDLKEGKLEDRSRFIAYSNGKYVDSANNMEVLVGSLSYQTNNNYLIVRSGVSENNIEKLTVIVE